MDIDSFKQRLQNHFSDGLVTIVGSGLSIAEGIPGMGQLAEHLLANVPPMIPDDSNALWNVIALELAAGTDLETALLRNAPDDHIESAVVDLTADLIMKAETAVIEEVITGRRVLRFTKLIPQMLKPETGIPIITTNYDRLLEVAVEQAGLMVNSLFVGTHFGRLAPDEAHMSICKAIVRHRTKHLLHFLIMR
jgi:hypothetical protein